MSRFADALILPETMKSGRTIFQRVAAVSLIAEPLLGTDRAAGQRAWIRKMPHGRLFITNSMEDTIFFPTGHPRSGQPRYRWEKRADGTELGYLLEDANARREIAETADVR